MRKWWMTDLALGLRYGSMMPYRLLLAIGAALYALFTALAPIENLPPVPSMVLENPWRWGWVAVFSLDAFLLGWRIWDDKPRLTWAWFANAVNAALWIAITVASIVCAPVIYPGMACYILVALMALIAFVRTEATERDRQTA